MFVTLLTILFLNPALTPLSELTVVEHCAGNFPTLFQLFEATTLHSNPSHSVYTFISIVKLDHFQAKAFLRISLCSKIKITFSFKFHRCPIQ